MKTSVWFLGLLTLAVAARAGPPRPPADSQTEEGDSCRCERDDSKVQQALVGVQEALNLQQQQLLQTATAFTNDLQQLKKELQEQVGDVARALRELLQKKNSTASSGGEEEVAEGQVELRERITEVETSCRNLLSVSSRLQVAPSQQQLASPEESNGTASSLPSLPSTSEPSLNATVPAIDFSSSTASSIDDEESVRRRVQLRVQEAKSKWQRAKTNVEGEALHRAIERSELEDVRRLVEAGADLNFINAAGTTPLISALAHIFPETGLVPLLLEAGAEVNAVDKDGATALHHASVSGDAPRVALLVGAGAEVDAREEEGCTPLHWAAANDHEAAVRALLAAGASRELRCWSGEWKGKAALDVADDDAVRDLLRP